MVQVCLIGFRAKLCKTVALQEHDWTPLHIVHDEGLESRRYYLKSRSKDALPPSDFIVRLTEWTLKKYIFYLKTACIDKKRVL